MYHFAASARKESPIGSTALVSVMFTDLVGSTELASSVRGVEADRLRQGHFALLTTAVEHHGGRVVKNLGDGIMAAFPTASAAVAAAESVQQAVDSRNRWIDHPAEVRVGLGVGEAACEDGDYFGVPVVEAARLCALAGGGEILATELVCRLAANAPDVVSEPLGDLELKGLPQPVACRRVSWRRPDAVAVRVLPERLGEGVPFGFVGREAERVMLEQALHQAATEGHQRAVVIEGPPGMGKTSLAAEVAGWAVGSSATVLYGRADEQADLPYQPFVEALADYVQQAPETVLMAHVERHGAVLTPLVPELAQRVRVGPFTPSADLESERYLLYGAVVGLLAAASAEAPLVVILDDLHWADAQTVALFRYIVRSRVPLRAVVVALARSDAGLPGLADLRSEPAVEVLRLDGLSRDEVVALMVKAAGHDLDDEGVRLAATLHDETGGNPLFVREILRHLAESGAIGQGPDGRWTARVGLEAIRLPESVREVIRSRTRHLSAAAFGALAVAAVLGREFDLRTVAEVARADEAAVLDALEEAVAASVVSEIPGRTGRFSFSHGLFQQAIYEDLGATRRQLTHLRTAEVLEERYGPDPGERTAELARHWSAVATPDTAVHAAELAGRAGDRALARLAPDEAMRWYTEALATEAELPERTRCRLLVGLGDAQRQSGNPRYRQTLLDAAALARRLDTPDLLVRAALANNRGFVSVAGVVDSDRVEVLQAAIDAVGPAATAERARLLSLLANELTYGGSPEMRRSLTDEALSIARRVGDPITTVHVLNLRFNAIWMPSTLAERLTLTAEAMDLSAEHGDPVARFWAAKGRADTAIEAGDLREAERCLGVLTELAESVGQPVLRWQARVQQTWRIMLSGRTEAAEAMANEAWGLGEVSTQPDAAALFGAQLVSIRWTQGRIGELQALIAETVQRNPGLAAMRAALVLTYADADDLGATRDALASALSAGVPPEEPTWLTAMACYAEAAAVTDDPRSSSVLYDRLRPWRDHVVANGTTCEGPVAHYLAGLAAALGRAEEADALYRLAAGTNERLECPFFTARTNLGWGRLLLTGDLDRDRGAILVADALGLARRHGMATVERRAGRLLELTGAR